MFAVIDSKMSILATEVPPQAMRARNIGRALLITITLAALWFILCWQLSGEWSFNEQYNYGWFVPFFALYLFWLRWQDRPLEGRASSHPIIRRTGQSPFLQIVIAIFALALLLPIRLLEIGNPDWRLLGWLHAAAVATLTLFAIWTIGGNPWLKHFAFPIGFFFVAIPWISGVEEPIVQGLMRAVAAIDAETLNLFGIPARFEGSVIRTNAGLVGVNEACSGVRSLQTSLMIGLLFGELNRLRVMHRFFLVVAAFALAFAANLLRTFFLVWIAATRGLPAMEHWHNFAGYAVLAIVVLGSIGVATWLTRNKVESVKAKVENGKATPRSHQSNFYFLLPTFYFTAALCWLIVVEIGTEAWYRAHERNLVPALHWTVRWPQSAPGLRKISIDEGVRNTLRYDEGGGIIAEATNVSSRPDVDLSASRRDAKYLLYFFRWLPGHSSLLRARAHRPDICLPSIGWRELRDDGVRTYDIGSSFALPFRHFEFVRNSTTAERNQFAHAFYCVWEDRIRREDIDLTSEKLAGAIGGWSRADRIRVVLEGRRNPGQQVMEVVLTSSRALPADDAEKIFSNLLRKVVVVEPRSNRADL